MVWSAFFGLCLLVARVQCSAQRTVDAISALRDAADLMEKGLLTEEEFRGLKRDLLSPLKHGANTSSSLPKFFGTALAAHTLPPRTELTVMDYQVHPNTLLSRDLHRPHRQQSCVQRIINKLGLATCGRNSRLCVLLWSFETLLLYPHGRRLFLFSLTSFFSRAHLRSVCTGARRRRGNPHAVSVLGRETRRIQRHTNSVLH